VTTALPISLLQLVLSDKPSALVVFPNTHKIEGCNQIPSKMTNFLIGTYFVSAKMFSFALVRGFGSTYRGWQFPIAAWFSSSQLNRKSIQDWLLLHVVYSDVVFNECGHSSVPPKAL
jgi:hypothetical protein